MDMVFTLEVLLGPVCLAGMHGSCTKRWALCYIFRIKNGCDLTENQFTERVMQMALNQPRCGRWSVSLILIMVVDCQNISDLLSIEVDTIWLVGIGHHCILLLEVPTPLSGNHLAFAPAIPLLKMYPKDTLLQIRIVIGLSITTFWSGKTGNDLGVCQLALGTDGVELSPSAKEWWDLYVMVTGFHHRVKWQVEKRTRWRVKSCSVLTFM